MVGTNGLLGSQTIWFKREQEGIARREGGGFTRRQFAKLGAATVAAAAIGTTGMFAYFTDEGEAVNRLSVSPDLDIEVVEPSWVEADARNMKPSQTVPKDPAVRNRSASAEGWVFLEVHVPMAEVVVYLDGAGAVSDASAKELFSFEPDTSKWRPMKEFETLEGGVRTKVYRYAWPDRLAPGETTDPIFEEITLANLVNDQGQAGEHVVGAVGRAVQTIGFSTPEDAWEALGVVDEEYTAPEPDKGPAYALLMPNPEQTNMYSLVFVRDGTEYSAGGSYNGRTITQAYADIEEHDGASAPWGSYSYSIVDVSFEDRIAPISTKKWFYNCTRLSTLDLTNLDTSRVSSMSEMFFRCESMAAITGTATLDTSNVVDLYQTFYGCKNLPTLDLSGWDTSKVTSMSQTFDLCTAMTEIKGLETFDVSKVKSFRFTLNAALPSLDISTWDTSSATTMEGIFTLPNVKEIKGLETLVVSNVTNFSNMFSDCAALESVDLSAWDFSAATAISNMFSGCTNLSEIKGLENMSEISPANLSSVFTKCTSLTGAALAGISSWNVSNATNFSNMFSGCTSLETLDLSAWSTSKASNMSYMFSGCTNLSEIKGLEHFVTRLAGNLSHMFENCSSFSLLDLSSFNTAWVTNMSYMFSGCVSLKTIYASADWSTTRVTSAGNMFSGCTALVGGNGTPFNDGFVSKLYARIDTEETPGYFTAKA